MRTSFLLVFGTAGLFLSTTAWTANQDIAPADTPILAVTNPFYHPRAGHVALTTEAAYHRTHVKNAFGQGVTAYQTTVFETMSLGLTDDVTLTGTFGNVFDRRSFGQAPTYQRDKNLDFQAGLTYTLPAAAAQQFQADLSYGQRQSFSRFQKGEYKYLNAGLKSGYRMENITSYVAGNMELPVAQNAGAHNEPRYQAVIGSNGLFVQDAISADVALRFNYESEYSVRAWSVDAGLAYLFTPTVALGVKVSYTFKGTGGNNTDWFHKSIGAFFKTAF